MTATYLPQIAALPPRDQRMVDLLAAGATQIRCAGVLGVNRSTVVRRLQP